MSQITLTSPFQALVNAKLFHRSHVRAAASTRHSDVHAPTRRTADLKGHELTLAQARLFTVMR